MKDIFADKKSTFQGQLNKHNTEVNPPDSNIVQTSFPISNIQQQQHSETNLVSSFSNKFYIGHPNNNGQENLQNPQAVNNLDNTPTSVPLFSTASFSSVPSIPTFPVASGAAVPPPVLKPEPNSSQPVPLFPPLNSGPNSAPNPSNTSTSKYLNYYIFPINQYIK